MRTLAFRLSLLFIFLIPWEGVIELPGLGSAAKVVGLATAACWAAAVVTTGRVRTPTAFQIAVCLFVCWNALSLLWSGDPALTLPHVGRWVQMLGMVLVLWDLYTTRLAVLTGLQAYVLGAYAAIGSALANYVAGNAFYSSYQRFSPSEQSNPDGFGFIVVLGIPVAWYLATSLPKAKWSSVLRFVNYAYLPAAFVGMVLSGTRTALIASLVGVAYALASFHRVRLAVRIPAFVLLTASIIVLLPRMQSLRSFQRLGTTYSELTEGDLNNRTNNWLEGLAAFPEHPFVGVGANMYRSVNSLGKLAHNSFLSVLVELGLIGFTLFAIILTIAVTKAIRHPRWDARFWLTLLAVWAIGASTLTYEHRKATWLVLSLVVASAAVIPARSRPSAELGMRSAERPARRAPCSALRVPR